MDSLPETVCKAHCADRSTPECLASCDTSLQKLSTAAASVKVGPPNRIELPSKAIRESLPKDIERSFDGMMFAGGVEIAGRDRFAARICTNRCVDQTSAGLYSTVVVGELSGSKGDMQWEHASALNIPHNTTGWFVGPEDPRLDAVNGARFVLANINVNIDGCKPVIYEYQKPR